MSERGSFSTAETALLKAAPDHRRVAESLAGVMRIVRVRGVEGCSATYADLSSQFMAPVTIQVSRQALMLPSFTNVSEQGMSWLFDGKGERVLKSLLAKIEMDYEEMAPFFPQAAETGEDYVLKTDEDRQAFWAALRQPVLHDKLTQRIENLFGTADHPMVHHYEVSPKRRVVPAYKEGVSEKTLSRYRSLKASYRTFAERCRVFSTELAEPAVAPIFPAWNCFEKLRKGPRVMWHKGSVTISSSKVRKMYAIAYRLRAVRLRIKFLR